MLGIVDHDNVPNRDRRLGLNHVVRKLGEKIESAGITPDRLRIRLYGGWYESSRLTKRAQELTREIADEGAITVALPSGDKYFADVELASASLMHPRTIITNTFRQQNIRGGIRCESRPWFSCAEHAACELEAIEEFFNKNSCRNTRCPVNPESILTRNEQKVVDTLMVADLVHASSVDKYENILVVTRDDDIWPGLCIAANHLKKLLHVSTAPSPRLPSYYSVLPVATYKSDFWS